MASPLYNDYGIFYKFLRGKELQFADGGDTVLKIKKLDLTANGGTSETGTGFYLPSNTIVIHAAANVGTAEGSAATVNIGTTTATGDPNGFFASLDANTTGISMGDGALLTWDAASGGEQITYTDGGTYSSYEISLYILYLVLS